MSAETTRRTLLKQLSLGAGATLLAPMVAQIAAHAAGDERAAAPRRVIFVMQSNGMNPAHLLPSGVERPKHGRPVNEETIEHALAGRTLPKAIEPLTPFLDRLTLLHGLSGRIALSDHSCNHGALGAYPANKGPMAQTIDSAVSEALPATFSHVALGYGGSTEPMNYRYSASGPGKAIPILCSPDLAFRSLFGSVAGGEGKQAFDRRTNLLDFMADDVRRAQAALVGDERQKLDRYLEAYESLHHRQNELVTKADALKRHLPQLGEKLHTETSSEILEAQFEIAACALLAGLTNTVTLISGGGGQQFGKFPEFNIPDLHGIGHGNAYGRASSDDCFIELRNFHTRLIARLAERLAAVKEGEKTMLDNTLIVYLSNSGESHHPNLHEWPVLLLGDLGGRLQPPGRCVILPKYGVPGHRTLANLWCTLLHAVGRPRDQFGAADPGLKNVDQTGPIAELVA